jgi:hypothetical protein
MFTGRHNLHPDCFLLVAFSILAALPSQAAETSDCTTRLARFGIKAERPATLPAPSLAACVITDPVVLNSITAAGQTVQFPDRPLLSCAMAERLARFSLETVSPMALSAFGKPLTSVSTGPGFECRPRNRQAGAKISSHGQGNAVDVMMMELSGGRKIVVEKPADTAAAKFLASFRTAACQAFNTVLGPGSDASHTNHIHIDIEPRGKSGTAKFCQ